MPPITTGQGMESTGRTVYAAGKLGGNGDVLRLGDGGTDSLRGGHQGFAITLLAQCGTHLAQHGARKAIGNNGFQPVAHFEPVAAVADHQQEQGAFVLALLADAPGAVDGVGDVVDGLAFKSVNGDKRYLRAGGALHGGAVGFELRLARGVDDVGEIADVALGLESFPIHRQPGRGQQAKQHAHPQPLIHLLLPVYYAWCGGFGVAVLVK